MEEFTVRAIVLLCEGDKTVLVEKLCEWGLILREGEYMCKVCGNPLSLQMENSRIDGFRWRCKNIVSIRKRKRTACRNAQEFRTGTIFEKSKLHIWQILVFTHLWASNVPLAIACSEAQTSSGTGVSWASFCRQILLCHFMEQRERLGGPDKIVEVYETIFGKGKYNRGSEVEAPWVIGGYESGSGRVFMVSVEDRSPNFLTSLIEKWILPGTVICSDYLKDYDVLERKGYLHQKANDPILKADLQHTNPVKSSLSKVKTFTKSSDTYKTHVPSKLARYMFQRKCKELSLDPTREFFKIAGNVCNPQEVKIKLEEMSDNENDFSD